MIVIHFCILRLTYFRLDNKNCWSQNDSSKRPSIFIKSSTRWSSWQRRLKGVSAIPQIWIMEINIFLSHVSNLSSLICTNQTSKSLQTIWGQNRRDIISFLFPSWHEEFISCSTLLIGFKGLLGNSPDGQSHGSNRWLRGPSHTDDPQTQTCE